MKRIKQFCASFLAVMMVITYMPAMAFAAGGVDWSSDHNTFVYDGQSYEAQVETVDPTCTEAGYTEYKAVVGGEVMDTFKEDGDPAKGHTAGEAVKENEVPATCMAAGSYDEVVYCTVCDEMISSTPKTIDKLSHVPADEPVEENVVPATCSTEGSYDEVYYCKFDCGTELSREAKVIDKTEHEWVLDEENSEEATCTKEGKNVYNCANCDATNEEVVPVKEHTPDAAVEENVVEATCTEDGSFESVVYCADCGAELSRDTVTTDALGHDFDGVEPVVVKEATCVEDGVQTFKCKTCGEDVEEAIPATGHGEIEDARVVEFVDTEATCTEEGLKRVAYYCNKCGAELDQEEVVIPMKEHEYEENIIDEPTCVSEGYAEYVCKNCGDSYEASLPTVEHTPGEVVTEKAVEATCEEGGSYDEVIYCTVCGEELSRESKTVEALGHDFGEWEVVDEATCTEAGLEKRVCSRCGAEETEVIEALGHDYVKDEDVSRDATCTREGEFVEVCSRCHDVHKETVPMLDHTPGDAVEENVVEATCTAEGSYDEVVYCTVCGGVVSRETKTIDMLEHEFEDVEGTAVEATCTEAGRTADQKCKNCDAVKEGEVIEALGHDWNMKSIKEETCEEDGEYYGICKRCGEVQESIIVPALGHKWGEKPASAKIYWSETNEGEGSVEYTYVCENDSTHTKTEVLSFNAEEVPEGASLTSEVTKEPTCTEVGETTYTFTSAELSDGSTVSESKTAPIAALEHAPDAVVKENVVEATCEEGGSYDAVVYCKNCGTYEFSREKVETEALGHDWDDAVVENEVNKPGTEGYDDTKPYEYDVVQHCARCGKSEVIEHVSVDAAGHNPGDAVKENEVEPTCTESGSYDLAIYCVDDGVEIARTTVEVEPLGHEYEWVLLEDECTNATCTEDGELVEGLICARCGEECDDEEYERHHELVEATGHSAEYTKQNVVYKEATATEDGYYADVTYCGVCGEELSVIKGETIPAATVAAKAAALKALAEGTDVASYPEDQQAAVAAAKAALAAAASDPNATAADLDAAEEAFNKAMEGPNAAKEAASYDAAVEAAAEAQVASKAITTAKYTTAAVNAVADWNTKLDTALKSGSLAKIKEYTAALNDAIANAALKAKNPITAKAKTKTLSAKAKKNTTITKAKAFKITKAQGKVTFKKASGDKMITVSSAGKITVKKGLKKGKTYTVKVKVTAAGNGNYLKGTKTVTLKIKVK